MKHSAFESRWRTAPGGNKRKFFRLQDALLMLSVMLALLVAAAGNLAAQSITTGDVSGVVTDTSGAVVPNATVILKSTESGATQSTATNGQGAYRFALLKPGSYSVTAEAAGFHPITQATVVYVGQAASVNLRLPVGAATQTVEVTAQAAPVETEDGNLTTTFDLRAVSSLPNPGNDLSAVALTAPGVVMNTTGGATFGGGNFSAYGLPSNSNLFTYDGADANDPYFNINTSGATNLTLGLNDVQETSVVSNGYSGQYGGLAGANINYVSKSGGNDFHGNAVYWWNGRTLNANNYFRNQQDQPRPFVNANQYAASLGGPIRKDKSFFFVDYEGIRLVIPSPISVNLPTTAFEQATLGNLMSTGQAVSVPFYSNLFKLWNGAPGSAAAQNTLPNGGCDNVNTASGAFAGFGLARPCALQLQGGSSQATNDYLIVGRFDQNLGNNDRLFARVQHESGQQATYTDPINPAFDAHSAQPEWQGQLSETHTFGNNKVNNLVVSGLWYSALFTMVNQNAANQAFTGTLAFADSALFNINNLGFDFPQGRNVSQYQIVDDFSWDRGRNSFKFGVNFRRDDVSDHTFFSPNPALVTFSLADFANGNGVPIGGSPVANLVQQSFPTFTDVPIALYQLGGYAEDDIRLSNSFKLTLSLRLDHTSNPVCQTDCFQRLAAPFELLSHSGPVSQAILTGRHQAFPSVTAVVAQPRIGFAWSPFGHTNTVIRGGAGIFGDAIPTGALDSILTNAPNDPTFEAFNAPLSTAAPNNLVAQAAASNAAFRSNFASGGAVPAFNFFNPTAVKIPRYYEWSLEVQHAIGARTSVSVKYVGNHGEHEEINNAAENAFSPTPFGNLPLTVPDQRFGVVTQSGSLANSNYNGLVLSATHSVRGGVQFQASYTYSHALDEISNSSLDPFGVDTTINADITGPLDAQNIRKYNYGNADYDLRQSFNLNYVWSDAFRHITSRGPNALLRGWTFSGTIFKHTGFPYTIYSSNVSGALQSFNWGNQNISSSIFMFADVIGNPDLNCGNSAAQLNNPCYNAANFADPVSDFGRQRRNQFRGPGFFDTDFSVEKSFALPGWERGQVSVGARFFNLFNHPNFGFPVTNMDSSQFGQILSTISTPTSIYGSGLGADASPRVIQLQAKFTF